MIRKQKAERQAVTQPLRQALRVYKWINGYGGKQTLQGHKKDYATWQNIVKKVRRKYLIFEPEDVDPTKLAEMNLYAIELIKESGCFD